jgi:hypothetical protein
LPPSPADPAGFAFFGAAVVERNFVAEPDNQPLQSMVACPLGPFLALPKKLEK